jgi:hypothetical protein
MYEKGKADTKNRPRIFSAVGYVSANESKYVYVVYQFNYELYCNRNIRFCQALPEKFLRRLQISHPATAQGQRENS